MRYDTFKIYLLVFASSHMLVLHINKKNHLNKCYLILTHSFKYIIQYKIF
jgi:hypothetical protein